MLSSVVLPSLSAYDSKEESEGYLDPLGLASTADRLADAVWPDFTNRMHRARFLTSIAAMAVVCERFQDLYAVDEVTPPHQVFEWYLVEAHARLDSASAIDTRNLPGIGKARESRRAGLDLSADRYLKTPSVFGFYGVYKRLASGLGVVDDDLYLGDAGFQLLEAWEQDRGLQGFSHETSTGTEGGRLRERWRDAVAAGLKRGTTDRSAGWGGWAEMVEFLRLDGIGRRERQLLRSILRQDGRGHQREFIDLVSGPGRWHALLGAEGEKKFLEKVASRCGSELRGRLEAIIAFENLARFLGDAWALLLHHSTLLSPAPLGASDFASVLPRDFGPHPLAGLIDGASAAMVDDDTRRGFEDVVTRFSVVSTREELFQALVERHLDVQGRKVRGGKRPWFDETGAGGILVRNRYRLPDPRALGGGFVNTYRSCAVLSMLRDLDALVRGRPR